jgi:hypothetical protein
MHNIEDEIVFANHDGYIFHDSRGLESGSKVELEIVQEFVRRRSRARRLKDRLHAIWFVPLGVCIFKFTEFPFRYCIPMDNDRPSLDLRHFHDVCPDKNGTSKRNSMNLGIDMRDILSSRDSGIHKIRPVQDRHRDEVGG